MRNFIILGTVLVTSIVALSYLTGCSQAQADSQKPLSCSYAYDANKDVKYYGQGFYLCPEGRVMVGQLSDGAMACATLHVSCQ